MNEPIFQVSTMPSEAGACVRCHSLRVHTAAYEMATNHPRLSGLFWRQHGACGVPLPSVSFTLTTRAHIAAAMRRQCKGDCHLMKSWRDPVRLNVAPPTCCLCLPTTWAFCVMFTREET